MLALIDGDELAHKIGYACQHSFYKLINEEKEFIYDKEYYFKQDAVEAIGDNNWIGLEKKSRLLKEYTEQISEEGLNSILLEKIKFTLTIILEKSKCNNFQIFFSSPDNFRYLVATIWDYKGNRNILDKPILLNKIKSLIQQKYLTYIANHIEADDCLGLAQNPLEGTVICTQDKDLNMVQGWRLNNKGELYYITKQAGLASFYRQLLTGDSIDNIPGIYGLGEGKAKNIIFEDMPEDVMYRTVWNTYYFIWQNPKPRLHVNHLLIKSIDDLNRVILEIGTLLWIQIPDRKKWLPPLEILEPELK